MTKEVLYFMSKKLRFSIDIFDNENNNNYSSTNYEQNNYLSITIPIVEKDQLTEDDEFKDEDINEMVVKNNNILEEKLKRQLPNNTNTNENKNSNFSTINIVDMLSKNEDDKKDSSDSFTSFPKNINAKNDMNISKNNLSNNNLNINDFQKNKYLSFNSTPSNDSFLSKCLKSSEHKKFDRDKKEKSKFKKYKQLNINLIQNKINKSGKNIFINITNINNSSKKKNKKYTKTKSYVSVKRNINKINDNSLIKNQKTHQLKGIFTLINKYGCSEEIDNCDQFISNSSNETKKIKKREITFHNQSPNPSLKSKPKQSKNTTVSQFNLDRYESGLQNSIKTPFKSSCFFSNIGENDEKNKNNNNYNYNKNNIIITNLVKNGVSIEYKKEEENKHSENSKHSKSKKNILLSGIEENKQKLKFSQNIDNNNNNKNGKDCMTFFIDKKNLNISKDNNNTLIDESLNENNNLFIEAFKETSEYLQKSINKNNIDFISQSNIEQNEEGYEEDEENEEDEEIEENEKSYEPSKEQCKCADLLVVDDEEFNVMASQRMLKNLGFESDKAFNGEECINLIKEKKELNCQCEKNYYKIIFLDIVMPVMDGIKTAKKIQEMIDNKEINENIKIIFISGNIDGADLQNSLLQIKCVKECLQKPVQIAKYQKLLEKYYNKNE